MKVFTVALTANQPAPLGGGNTFVLIATSAPLNVLFYKGGVPQEQAVNVQAGYQSYPLPNQQYSGLLFDVAELTSAVNQTVTVGVAQGSGTYNRTVGAVTSTAQQGTTPTESSVTCTAADTEYVAVAANANRFSVRFYNPSTNTGEMVLYGLTGTLRANAVIHILPGGMVSESDAAPAQWFVKSAVAGETLKVQEIT